MYEQLQHPLPEQPTLLPRKGPNKNRGLLLARLAVYFAMVAIFLQVILSWVNPASPLAPVAHALTRPMLRPIQRIVPPIGMVDLSPLVALLMLQLLLMVPLAYLERWVGTGL